MGAPYNGGEALSGEGRKGGRKGLRVSAAAVDVSLHDLLGQLPPGVPKCVFVEAVEEALATLERAPNPQPQRRLAVLHWPVPPRLDDAIGRIVEELATLAHAVWPSWFGLPPSPRLPSRERLLEISQAEQLSPEWIVQAWNDCQQGRLPLSRQYVPAVAVRHLAKAIAGQELVFVLVAGGGDPADVHLDGLCRLAQWLAAQTRTRCGLLLDAALQGSPELASIDYEPRFWPCSSQEGEAAAEHQQLAETSSRDSLVASSVGRVASGGDTAAAPTKTSTTVAKTAGRAANPARGLMPRADPGTAAACGEAKLRLGPILGQPHPLSPGEQRLAQLLAADAVLAGRFRFNWPVLTVQGNTFVVDLLAADLKLVVEVDGYTHHCGRVAFRIDRQRDYELLTSGYLVLRLPYDEIIESAASCLEKVRHLVAFRLADRSF